MLHLEELQVLVVVVVEVPVTTPILGMLVALETLLRQLLHKDFPVV
tara:strand:+ start:306 stop:443 length:138 start_codon:yes stop_codon:yes gene_type:complete